ncbi:hypothetical protein Dimus_006746 [Dionaea muscipula]
MEELNPNWLHGISKIKIRISVSLLMLDWISCLSTYNLLQISNIKFISADLSILFVDVECGCLMRLGPINCLANLFDGPPLAIIFPVTMRWSNHSSSKNNTTCICK